MPENLALKAKVTVSSEYSKQFGGANVADGRIPGMDEPEEKGRSWAVANGRAGGATLTLEWPASVTVAQVVYFGRTIPLPTLCWRDWQIFLDGADKAAAAGRFQMAYGPQPITLPQPAQVRKVMLTFTSSYGGPNPGAFEVQVYGSRPPPGALGKLVPIAEPVKAPRAAPRAVRPPNLAELTQRPESQKLAEDLQAGRLGFSKIVLAQRRPVRCSHVYTYHNEGFQAGGGLYVFTPGPDGGKLDKLVDSPQGQVLNCDLSYDGREVLFSWRKGPHDFYQVYRIHIDGSALTQITDHPSYNFDACWLPDGGIVFLSTRKPQVAYCWTSGVGILYRMGRDGGNVRQISGNYLNDFTPCVTNDGQIMYCRWEYVDRPAGVIHGLWTLNPDGTGLAGFFGNRVLNPCTFMEPQPIPGTRKILCTLTSHNGSLGGGVGIIDPIHGNNAQESIRNLTPEINIGYVDRMTVRYGPRGPYQRPFPLDQKLFLVSRAGTVLLRDYDGTKLVEVLAPRDGMGFYSPQPVRVRPRPPVIASSLPPVAEPWATLVLQDLYNGLEPHVQRGEVRRICVVQEVEKPEAPRLWLHPEFGYQFPVVSCGATYSAKKVWGFAPVAEDGSACFRVPAGKPIYFMALDAKGRAVQRMRSFTHLMPGEVQGCRGCHESRQGTSMGAGVPASLRGPPSDLTPPDWGVVGFSYPHVVQPVLDRHCVRCHKTPDPPKGLDLGGDKTDYFNVSYEYLARQKGTGNPYTRWISTLNGREQNILIITPKVWGSPASKLADVVLSGHPDAAGKPRVQMTQADRQRILTWIDLNVPYYGASRSKTPNLPGCRQAWPAELDKTLARVAAERCASCHPGRGGRPGIPRKRWVRITNPQLNDFLLAPLGRSAGGTEKCGKPVFPSTDDADYQAILRTFAAAEKLLRDSPRGDMVVPAARPLDCPTDTCPLR